ncbi:hypothetical protein AMAG_00089 [Allomyces macrogynus ATCC 38327]|uniref:Ubiquitin-like domain-containing protein n=1 Tax=Allomyces macrogynus (strain ATCC 38327) TaxID=578462 RepID=A0A0L0RUM4_ALLM3|nr:hypothetical protein AMAG_00089 [Allomyces macrogynus ATCC 38327]|eukprot:KNE54087.1 hypothetical protein AMAG_00089 [Allomyces macrogynus ATCC 38327]
MSQPRRKRRRYLNLHVRHAGLSAPPPPRPAPTRCTASAPPPPLGRRHAYRPNRRNAVIASMTSAPPLQDAAVIVLDADLGLDRIAVRTGASGLLLREYQRFLALKVLHHDSNALLLSPRPAIDQFWHAHILDTKAYAAMCAKLPFFIHHDPAGAFDPASRAHRRAATLATYRARFGEEPIGNIWAVDPTSASIAAPAPFPPPGPNRTLDVLPAMTTAHEFLDRYLDLVPLAAHLYRFPPPELPSPTLVPHAVREYRRFIALKVLASDVNDTLLAPSPLVGAVWAAHVLDTRAYAGMCSHLPFFPHHDPTLRDRTAELAITADLYRAQFGTDPPAAIWAPYADPPLPLSPVSLPPTPTSPPRDRDRPFGPSAAKLRIHIASPGTPALDLVMDPNATVRDLMWGIYRERVVPLAAQRLTYLGWKLDGPEWTLSECGIESGATVVLREAPPRVQGGQVGAPTGMWPESATTAAMGFAFQRPVASSLGLTTATTWPPAHWSIPPGGGGRAPSTGFC